LFFFADSINATEEDNAKEDIKQEHDTGTIKEKGLQNHKPQKAYQQEQKPALPTDFSFAVTYFSSHF
jgi:hypothetical protein